jgi:autotransporter-associated beta strand protein
MAIYATLPTKLINRPLADGLRPLSAQDSASGKYPVSGVLSILLLVLLAALPLQAEDFDWRSIDGMNFLTPVRYQDHTGMCWAFSSVAALESLYKITRNDPIFDPDLSEQQLACAGMGDAVIGGVPSSALGYFKTIGIVTEEELPFTKTNYSPLWPLASGWQERVYKIDAQSGFMGDVDVIKDNLKRYGPIITEMQVDSDWYGPEQGPARGGHAVLITGFHDDPGLPGGGYFIVKNSWGDWWGDQGYGKILYSSFGSYTQWMITGPAYVMGPSHTFTFDTSTSPGYQCESSAWSTAANVWTTDGVNLQAWQNGEDAALFHSDGGACTINIENSVIAHAVTFQDGAGEYTLTGGSLTVTHGGITANENVLIQSDITIGAPQQWTIAAGKTLSITGAINTHISPLTVSGPGDTIIHGTISDVHANPSFSGLLGGFSGSLLKSGSGTLRLTAANNYTGNTTVSAGTLALSGPNGAILASPIYLDGGRLLIDNSLDNHPHRIAGASGVTLRGGELALQGHVDGTSENIDKLLLNSNYSILTVIAQSNVAALSAPSLGRSAGATALVRGTNLGSGSSGAVGQIRFNTPPALSNSGAGDQIGIVPYLIGDNNINGSGSDLVTYNTNGLRTLAGNEYASSLLADRNIRLSGGPTSANSLVIRSLVLENSGTPSQVTVNSGGILTISSGAILSIGSVPNSVSGGSITFGNNAATRYEGIVHVVQDMTIQSSIANNGSNAVSLTKAGAGMLTLIGDNTYSGQTYISGGTLRVGDGGTAGSLVGPITNNAELVFQRADMVVYIGAISGTGRLTKLGENTLILTGYNTYSGGTTIAAGTLQIGNGGSSGSITGDILNNSELVFNRAGTSTFSGLISGSGSLTKLGGGILILKAANTYLGSTVIISGKLKLFPIASLASNLIDIRSGVFDVLSVDDYTLDFGQTITGCGTLAGAATIRGTVAPGETLGALSVGDLTFADGSLLDIELGGSTSGLSYDVLNSSGDISLLVGSKLRLTLIDDFLPGLGDAFDIMNFSNLMGAFSLLDLPQLDGGYFWDTSNLYLDGTVSVVPEPGISVLLFAAFVAILCRKILRRPLPCLP